VREVSRWIALLVLLSLSLAPAGAAVRFSQWSPDSVDNLLRDTAEAEQFLMVVITQPDWCPGCIELDRSLLRNPEAGQIAALTRDWVVIEVLGYDEPGASLLADQQLGFLGTPTTLLLKPGTSDQRLGDATQMAAIVGVPEDYVEQLERAAAGHGVIAEAQARVREHNDADSLRALADAYLAAGDAMAARRVFQSLLLREELSADERRKLALEAVVLPSQRVEKDHQRTLDELAVWLESFPAGSGDPAYIYARVWSTLALGRVEEGMALIREAYLDSDDPGALADYLYLVFRHPSESLLADAEARARQGVTRFPEQAARFHAAHGRILRRQGRFDAAEQAFSRAVELTAPDHPSRVTYLGQLEFVRQERTARAN
jgi:hypothetical protein